MRSDPGHLDPPSLSAASPGFVQTSRGLIGVSGQVVTITGVRTGAGMSVTVSYGFTEKGTQGITVPGQAGTYVFITEEASKPAGALKATSGVTRRQGDIAGPRARRLRHVAAPGSWVGFGVFPVPFRRLREDRAGPDLVSGSRSLTRTARA